MAKDNHSLLFFYQNKHLGKRILDKNMFYNIVQKDFWLIHLEKRRTYCTIRKKAVLLQNL